MLAQLSEARLLQLDTVGAEATLRDASDALDAWRVRVRDAPLRLLAYQSRDRAAGDAGSVEAVIAGVAASGRVDAAYALAERQRARALYDALAGAGSVPIGAADLAARLDARTALVQFVADFQNADAKGRLRLNCVGTIEDLASQGIRLQPGLRLRLYSDDLEAEGAVEYSEEEHLWVAVIDWRAIETVSP